MTTNDKLEMLKSTVEQLYSKEGRSKRYIAELLKVNRKKLSDKIKEWNLKEAEPRRHLTPSNQKFLNANRNLIKSRLDNDIPIEDIAKELKVERGYLSRTIIDADDVLKQTKREYLNRMHNNAQTLRQRLMDKSSLDYDFKDLDGEEWRPILGYDGYMISNHGRVKHLSERYQTYHLVHAQTNAQNGRDYVSLYKNSKRKNLQISHLVAHAFVSGHSEVNCTVNHKDGNPKNNHADNLEWVSQSQNNQHAYTKLRRKPSDKRKYEFSKIIYKNK